MDAEWYRNAIDQAPEAAKADLRKAKAECEFTRDILVARPDAPAGAAGLFEQAEGLVATAVASNDAEAISAAVREAEALLAPLGKLAKEYTIHCVGHAHIDMNWMWSWPETVATVNDTFTTVVRLMREIPQFHFSQSQTSVYQIMKDYLPELYADVKELIAQGRWEVTATQWVEADTNMASGEALCRQILYTRSFMKQEFGLDATDVTICFEPDTFGHARTMPTILNHGGVTRYYLHRASHGPKLFWWQAGDGARVLTFDDCDRGYNGVVNEDITRGLAPFIAATGMKDHIFMYGVGDHGGGPTRRDLLKALEMDAWPLFPHIALSTTDAFFSAAERDARNLPVVDKELNTVFEGCYTTQTVIKLDNRRSENALVEAETYGLLGESIGGVACPHDGLRLGWRHTLFSQFHDILPGSGTRETRRYSDGLFQEVMTQTGMAKTRALRAIAAKVDTQSCAIACEQSSFEHFGPTSMGAGQGEGVALGAVSHRSPGNPTCDAFVVFNPSPWQRTELLSVKVWDRNFTDGQPALRDATGGTIPGQVTGTGGFWGHAYTEVAFPAKGIPALGYHTYAVGKIANAHASSYASDKPAACGSDGKGTIWNEFLELTVSPQTGAICRLYDKRTGRDLAAPGGRLGGLGFMQEAPHPMSAWVIGSTARRGPLAVEGPLTCGANGPYLASVTSKHVVGNSRFSLTVSLSAGVPRVEFLLDGVWYERGSAAEGVPSLYATFPLAVEAGEATFECPNGHVARPTGAAETVSHTTVPSNSYNAANVGLDMCGKESPAQRWVDLSNAEVGATLLNDSKYGFAVVENTINMTLIRSSYEPDPVPEQGQHTVRYALLPHDGSWTVSDATRAGTDYNMPVSAVGAGLQAGPLAARNSYGELLTPNAIVTTLKRAEDGDGVIVRLYETEGKAVRAQLALGDAFIGDAKWAVATDLMETALPVSTASLEGGVVAVDLPAFGMATVRIR